MAFPSHVGTVFSCLTAVAYTNVYGFMLYYIGKDFITLLCTPGVNEEVDMWDHKTALRSIGF